MSDAAAEITMPTSPTSSDTAVGTTVHTAEGQRPGVLAAWVPQGVAIKSGHRVYALPHSAVVTGGSPLRLRLAMAALLVRRARYGTTSTTEAVHLRRPSQ
jgi:hypothetical protein